MMSSSLADIRGKEASIQKLTEKINRIRDRLIREKGTNISAELKLEDELAEHEAMREELKKQLTAAYRIGSSTEGNLIADKLASFDERFSDDIGLLHRVNMNRDKMTRLFFDFTEKLEDETYQFYFITACPSQMPPSFAERLIFEYVEEEFDGDTESIRYPLYDNTGRLKFDALPQKRSLKNCIEKAFPRYFSSFFGFPSELDFATFIAQGIPNIPEAYVCMVFEIQEKKWDQNLTPDYLEWIIKTFAATHEEVPRFLFFFVTYIQDLHLNDDVGKPIVNILDDLAGRFDQVVHLKPLRPVAEADVRAWLLSIGIRNDRNIETLIDMIKKGLRKEDLQHYQQTKEFNMADLELVQQAICNYLDKQ